MKVTNARREIYVCPENIPMDVVADNKNPSDKRPLFGSVFEMTFGKNADFAKGKYASGFSKSGRKAILIRDFIFPDTIYYEAIDGSNEPLYLAAQMASQMPFWCFDRLEDIFSSGDLMDAVNTKDDVDLPVKKEVGKDKRAINHDELLYGKGSYGKVFHDFTINDDIFDKFTLTTVNGIMAVVRIIKVDRENNEITFEIMRSDSAHSTKGRLNGFGTYTANLDGNPFMLYEFFRDAVKDFHFLTANTVDKSE